MPRFIVRITEQLEKKLIVEADTAEEAEEKITERYENSEIILTADNHTGTEIKADHKIMKKDILRQLYSLKDNSESSRGEPGDVWDMDVAVLEEVIDFIEKNYEED